MINNNKNNNNCNMYKNNKYKNNKNNKKRKDNYLIFPHKLVKLAKFLIIKLRNQ